MAMVIKWLSVTHKRCGLIKSYTGNLSSLGKTKSIIPKMKALSTIIQASVSIFFSRDEMKHHEEDRTTEKILRRNLLWI